MWAEARIPPPSRPSHSTKRGHTPLAACSGRRGRDTAATHTPACGLRARTFKPWVSWRSPGRCVESHFLDLIASPFASFAAWPPPPPPELLSNTDAGERVRSSRKEGEARAATEVANTTGTASPGPALRCRHGGAHTLAATGTLARRECLHGTFRCGSATQLPHRTSATAPSLVCYHGAAPRR